MAKLKIKKGDTVKVTTGNDKGKTGTVLRVLPSEGKVIVEGVRVVKNHTKPSAANPQGGIVEREAAIDVSNVALVDGGEVTKVGRKEVDGKLKRYAKKTDKILD